MHYQTRSPARERDHRISLMPIERPAGEPPIWLGTLVALCCLGVIVAGALFFEVAF